MDLGLSDRDLTLAYFVRRRGSGCTYSTTVFLIRYSQARSDPVHTITVPVNFVLAERYVHVERL